MPVLSRERDFADCDGCGFFGGGAVFVGRAVMGVDWPLVGWLLALMFALIGVVCMAVWYLP